MIVGRSYSGLGKILRVRSKQQVAEVTYWLAIQEGKGGDRWEGHLWAVIPEATVLSRRHPARFLLLAQDGTSGKIQLTARTLNHGRFQGVFIGVGKPPA
jgi:hypothetical protein